MPPWILAAIPVALGALSALIALAALTGPFLVPLWAKTVNKKDREKILAAAKGAYNPVKLFVTMTPTTLDNDLPRLLQIFIDGVTESLKEEVGAKLVKENPIYIAKVVESMVAKDILDKGLAVKGGPAAVAGLGIGAPLGKLDLKR